MLVKCSECVAIFGVDNQLPFVVFDERLPLLLPKMLRSLYSTRQVEEQATLEMQGMWIVYRQVKNEELKS